MAVQVGIRSTCIKSLDGLAYTRDGRNLKVWSNFEDWNCGEPTYPGLWCSAVSGAGANAQQTVGTALKPGQLIIGTGTTAAGRACERIGVLPFIVGGGIYTFETDINITALSTAIEEYALYMGFGDTVTGDQVDGIYFRYDRTTSLNWLLCSANNSVRTAFDSGWPVISGAWIRLKVIVNILPNALFYINNTLVGTNILNIPVARNTGAIQSIVKSVGLTDRTFILDWSWLHYDLTTTR